MATKWWMETTSVLSHFSAGERGRKAFVAQQPCEPPPGERHPQFWREGWEQAQAMYEQSPGYAQLVDRVRRSK